MLLRYYGNKESSIMKRMKKVLALVFCAVVACVVLTGCASQFHGTWKSVAVESDGKKITKDDKDGGEMVKDFMTVEIEKGGDATVSFSGTKKSVEWEADGDNITLTADGDDLDGKLDGDQLVFDLEGEKIYLEKED